MIIWDSKTGNVERFVSKLNIKNIKINKDLSVNEPYILITYTTKFGEVPESTLEFLLRNHEHMVGVASSGNMNWGDMFALAADKISKKYDVPIIHKFELSGTNSDVEKILQEVKKFE